MRQVPWDTQQRLTMDEELDKLKPVGLPVDKQHWNIEDLNAYVTI